MCFRGGSTPRLRGIREWRGASLLPARFNPAPAGNPPLRPDVAGLIDLGFNPAPAGNPAPMSIASPTNHRRFNPAPAGNPTPRGLLPWQSAVQPRACGESCPMSVGKDVLYGSTPRLRGIHSHIASADQPWSDRFNPAPAGNPECLSRNGSVRPVQPRACGESRVLHDDHITTLGSTPRLRGIHSPEGVVKRTVCGSTPRLRGILGRHPPPHTEPGFNPAPAGNPPA